MQAAIDQRLQLQGELRQAIARISFTWCSSRNCNWTMAG